MTPDEFVALIRRGDATEVQRALAAQPALAGARQGGVSVICLVVYAGQRAVAMELARRRTDLDIFEAACVGDATRVGSLLGAAPGLVNTRSPDGFQALGFACFFGHPEVFEVLVAAGAELQSPAENAMRVRPLHSAVAHADIGVARHLATRLLELGVSPNSVQQGGCTPLHEAALRGDAHLVALLLRYGAAVGALNEAGDSPAVVALLAG